VTAAEPIALQPMSLDAQSATSPARPGVLITFRTPMRYSAVWALQQHFHAERLAGTRSDTLILLEHLPVYTAGRRTLAGHIRPECTSANIPIETVSRGGSVTYHGPGQLIAYPIFALTRHARGVKAYVGMLEEVLIRTLRCWDIQGYRKEKAPGVWTRNQHREVKIASIGARLDRGITLHGFALNVNNDLAPFSRIVPCGLEGCRMTSMAETLEMEIPLPLVAEQVAEAFSTVFHLQWTTSSESRMTQNETVAAATQES
jgi:lipoyl(octanoyl) transferase